MEMNTNAATYFTNNYQNNIRFSQSLLISINFAVFDQKIV